MAASVLKYEDAQEFYAEFTRVEGDRGTVLIFPSDDEAQDMALAESIATVIDEEVPVSSQQARADASYVLNWLRNTNAPENIVALQERVVESLGGYVGPTERITGLFGG